MKLPNDITIHIPVAIATLPDLTLIEKIFLSRIDEFPACHNADLAALTGLSLHGVENTLARLRERGLIQVIGKGRARRLWLHVEHHIRCG
jgi:DNA-binding MarR family transcriptional regulator